MKLTYFQLESHLTKQLVAAYLISGEELLLKNEAMLLIRKKAKQEGFSERIRITPENGFDWEQLYPLLNSPSLLKEKQLIELDLRNSLPDKTADAILQDYSRNPASDRILLVQLGKLEDKISKSAWFKSLDKIGITMSIWPIPKEQFPQWIIQRCKKYKLSMNHDIAVLLADYVEGNLSAAAQTIEKIYLALSEQQLKQNIVVDHDLVKSILVDESRFSLFDFVENLIAGNISRSLNILQNLKQEGSEPSIILWAIARELRLLNELSKEVKQGHTLDQLFQKHRIFSRRQFAIRQFLTRFAANDCLNFLAQTATIDKLIKGALPGNVWESLQLFCLRMLPSPINN